MKKELYFDLLDLSNFDGIKKLESLYIKDSNQCMKSDDEDIIKCLKSETSTGVFHEGKLIAYSLSYINEYHIAFIDKCFVLPEYRGKGLQEKMISYNIKDLEYFRFISIYAMCSPYNHYSLSNFRKNGFMSLSEECVNGYQRIILSYTNTNLNNI